MIIPAVNDIAFSLFGFQVYKYGITLALAIFVGILTANKLWNKLFAVYRKNIIIDYAPLLIIAGILGARLYFCILNFNYYFANPLEILDFRQGGLSLHGSVIAGILCLFYISKKENINLLNILDTICCGTILGQAIGRWGNYFNSEAYGVPVEGQNWGLFVPLEKRVSLYSEYSLFHPAFLYESILNLVLFILLIFLLSKVGKKYKGFVFCIYLTGYSLIRFFVESIRVDSALNIAHMHVAQLVSLIFLFIGIIGIVFIVLKHKKYP